ncbi:MAG: hypothetical protein FXF47_04420 [Candidatus Mcinerneyibacterium aminivorans]|jgi:Tfp pilus assembly protein PilN|uniref:PilN domain-containing protein n=1 Tax=Candidatus Mcinerneyibacterium aminivorans TaxID=2703815 RepID=A0A5D0MJK3_9BACT|nr:MAG: hypothetical protein FXF47_04420 [Candidatus Mcinerneyibacterium aminivorans]
MIEINLLPKEERKTRQRIPIKKILPVIIVAAILLLMGLTYFRNLNKINSLNSEIDNLEREKNRYVKFKKEYDSINKQLKSINQRLNVLKSLEEGKTYVAQILQQLLKSVPENLWLNEMQIQQDTLSLKGKCLYNSDITKFIENLDQQKNIEDPVINKVDERKETFQEITGNSEPVKISNFTIDATLVSQVKK